MENLTIVGLKEMNQKLGKIERSLDSIAKSLSTLVKITDRQFPQVRMVSRSDLDPREIFTPDVIPFPEEDDDE